jgi:cytochrome c biogenesis protein CcmG/thiol:disulfide interchange protein DsbE
MNRRWIAAAVMAGGLGLMVASGSGFDLDGSRARNGVCDPEGRTANLSYTLQNENGKSVSLAAFKGKVIILDFWATWCPPCKIEMPWFVEFQDKYRAKGLVVLGVSVDDTPAKLKAFATEKKINYPLLVGRDREDMQDAYGPLWGVPTTFVIGRDGKICKKHTGLAAKAQFEREILALF